MNVALSEYIKAKNIGIDGTPNGAQDEQRVGQQQYKQQNEQRNVQRSAFSAERNGQPNQQSNRRRNLQRNGQNGQYRNQNNFQRHTNERQNMNNRSSFDLRSKCGRNRQQQQQQQHNRRATNVQYTKRRNYAMPSATNTMNTSNTMNATCNGGIYENQLGIWGLNHANQYQQHQNVMTSPYALQCAGVLNSCSSSAAAAAIQQQQQQQQLMPILHQHIPAGNAIVPYNMVQHQPLHTMSAMVPAAAAAGMHHNYHNHSCGHTTLGCQPHSNACIAAATTATATAGGGCGSAASMASNLSFDRTSTVMSAISRLLSNNATPLHLSVQVQSPRIAEHVEEMSHSN